MKPRRKKGRLYDQWVKHGDLPPEPAIQKESSGDKPARREKNAQQLQGLYLIIILGVLIFIFIVAVILFLAQYS